MMEVEETVSPHRRFSDIVLNLKCVKSYFLHTTVNYNNIVLKALKWSVFGEGSWRDAEVPFFQTVKIIPPLWAFCKWREPLVRNVNIKILTCPSILDREGCNLTYWSTDIWIISWRDKTFASNPVTNKNEWVREIQQRLCLQQRRGNTIRIRYASELHSPDWFICSFLFNCASRLRREARIRENYDRISAALQVNESKATKNPTRNVPDVPGKIASQVQIYFNFNDVPWTVSTYLLSFRLSRIIQSRNQTRHKRYWKGSNLCGKWLFADRIR